MAPDEQKKVCARCPHAAFAPSNLPKNPGLFAASCRRYSSYAPLMIFARAALISGSAFSEYTFSTRGASCWTIGLATA